MNKRPIAVLVIACVYILTGAAGTAAHSMDYLHSSERDMIWAVVVSVIAIVAGIYMLQGCNWARWLAEAWMAFHVVLSVFHAKLELAIHGALFAVITYFLFRPEANRYFKPAPTKA